MALARPVRWLPALEPCVAGPSSGLLRPATIGTSRQVRSSSTRECRACSSIAGPARRNNNIRTSTPRIRHQEWRDKHDILSLRPKQAIRDASSSANAGAGAHSDASIIDELEQRGILHQLTSQTSLRKHLANGCERTVYVGIDPSADSIHVGNLLPLVAVLHFLNHGHRVVIVVGGATGSIGDPSGRSTERQAISRETVMRNVQSIRKQIEAVMNNGVQVIANRRIASSAASTNADFWPGSSSSRPAQDFESLVADLQSRIMIVNNLDWYEGMNVLTFLRDVGKLVRVGTMLARDSVKSRMSPDSGEGAKVAGSSSSSQPSEGLSFTEFSYQLLQAYDFHVLTQPPYKCTVQIGGSDQMGNIAAGVDLIRRMKVVAKGGETGSSNTAKSDEGHEEDPAYGLTLPLLTTASGAKLGKSAGNAVWLDGSKSGNHDFFQYFYRFRDDEVEKYLKALTLLPVDKIHEHMARHAQDPSARHAQHVLATEVMKLVRTQRDYESAAQIMDVVYGNASKLTRSQIEDAFRREPSSSLLQRRTAADVVGKSMTALLVDVGLVSSKGEARRAIGAGAIRINGTAVQDPSYLVAEQDISSENGLMLISQGHKKHRAVLVYADEQDMAAQ